ncbi:MAG: AraC family transcriptional regulator [Lachnospiraceae bacterium]|jgi:AraC family transcriptional regulator|nr:AraC family transcriptional regulator [Lachnospiraceae bacterium]MCI8996753.1 AraC family transcriptional regulator [Lachnospiraceae bacterium]MCI9133733.1 AraC family transcriptional regulator [Lachnospiraceae bacterium]
MLTQEYKVKKGSEYFVWTPSALARETFFYPLVIGRHFYEKDYFLHRESFDSFLLMHIRKGTCTVCSGESICQVREGQTVLLDCYQSHAYYSETEWEALWVHFDGPMSRKYYEAVTGGRLLAASHEDPARFQADFGRLYQPFQEGTCITEIVMSSQITQLLTNLSLARQAVRERPAYSQAVAESLTYIQEHLAEEGLSLERLSGQANLSLYYYSRLFKRETGYTPHEYIILSRLNAAKFLLRSSGSSVKEICYRCGFYSESAFCSTFRRWEGVSPGQYRKNTASLQRKE